MKTLFSSPTVGTGSNAARLPHLQRFASPAEGGFREEPTTICGDIQHAAHVEVERLEKGQTPMPHLEAMLGVISYCYTKGLFNSEEIERELWEKPAFLASFGDRLPTAQQIRSFRRRNRPLIFSIIEQAIDEFTRREPCSVRRQVLAFAATLDAPAQLIAEWLLNMASFSDAADAD